MCEIHKPIFRVFLEWVAAKGEIESYSFRLPYGGDITDLDSVFYYLVDAEEVSRIGNLDIPRKSEVQVLIGTQCSECFQNIGFGLMQTWMINTGTSEIGKFLAEDLTAEMMNLPVPAQLFINYFVEELGEWLEDDE